MEPPHVEGLALPPKPLSYVASWLHPSYSSTALLVQLIPEISEHPGQPAGPVFKATISAQSRTKLLR